MAEIQVLQMEPEEIRPVDSTEFITPPNWVVRLVSTNSGKRGPHYPMGWTRTHSSYPAGADDYFPWGYAGEAGYDYSAYNVDPNWRTAYARRKLQEEEEENRRVIRGNLSEEQYRFWNGSSMPGHKIATCRWCRTWCYSPEAMRKHHDETDHHNILAAIYKCAQESKVRICFTCHSRTKHAHWGIPLCPRNSCRNKWRVAPVGDVAHVLLMYAKYAFGKGLLKPWLNEDKSEKFNIATDPKQFSWDRTGTA